MDFRDFLFLFIVMAACYAGISYAWHEHKAQEWRRKGKNFRALRPMDLARTALLKALALTVLVWLAMSSTAILAIVLGFTIGFPFQRAVEA